MREPVYIVLAVLCVAITALVVIGGRRNSIQPSTGAVLGALGVVLWGVFIQSSFGVITVSGGSTFEHSYPELAMLGVAGAGVSLVALFKGAIGSLDR